MTAEQYFPNEYQKDAHRFGEGCICAATLQHLHDKNDDWPNLEHFLICEYELNLIHQTIYAYFRDDYATWLQVGIVPHDCRCDHGGFCEHPIRILEYAESNFPEYNLKEKITKDLLLQYDRLFLAYIDDLCSITPFVSLTTEKLMNAVQNDTDKQRPVVERYLSNKVLSQ